MISQYILHNAKIFTVDQANPWAEALIIEGNRIKAVGSNDELLAAADPETPRIDIGGRLVLPGLCDAHIHLYYWALARKQVSLATCDSLNSMLEIIYQWAGKIPPGAWLSGWGWNEGTWPEQSMPTREDLDQVTGPHRPAIFWRSDMHAAVVNSAALRTADIQESSPDPAGGLIGRDPDGIPNGLLWELAINKVSELLPELESGELDSLLSEAIEELHRLGITAVHDQRMKDQNEGPVALAAYQRLAREGRLKLRVNCNIAAHDLDHLESLGLSSGFGDNYLHLGHVKFFADGTMGSKTAWMLEPYEKSHVEEGDYAGVSLTPPKQLVAEFRRACLAGFPISVHAIGDRANKTVLDILEEISSTVPQPHVDHRIEHVQIIDPTDIPRLGELGVTASVQPLHLLDDMEMAVEVLGDKATRVYNFGRLARSGARLALGSDAPVADPNPFFGFQAAIFRQRPENMASGPFLPDEVLTLEETINGYTLGAAEAAGWEELIGSISPGKLADVIVLDRDIFQIGEQRASSGDMSEASVWLTLFDGQIVYRQDD
jgi:predicted amidohydrolase YtcJ